MTARASHVRLGLRFWLGAAVAVLAGWLLGSDVWFEGRE